MTVALEKERILSPRLSLFLLVLGIFTYFSYSPVLTNKFTNWDDPNYVKESPFINLIEKGQIKPFFTSNHMGNYHPFSLISLSLDYQADKFNPNSYHRTNLILHILNTLLVFLLVFRLIGNANLSFLTALLFGVHPIHAESVAWISERKDVLFTFFFLGSLCLYNEYIKAERKIYYWTSLVVFIFSTLSKGMAVSLAPTLLLVDYLNNRKLISRKVLTEKLPFFIIAIVFGIIAIRAQSLGPDTEGIPDYNFLKRLIFAAHGFCQYLLKLIYPFDLVAFYPYPQSGIPFYYFVEALLIAVVISGALYIGRKDKVWIFSILFFVFNIILVLQILPVGRAIMADRYAYIPSISFFLLIVIYLEKVISTYVKSRYVFYGVMILYILFLAIQNFNQAKIWKDSIALWNYSIEHIPSDVAFNNRGVEYNSMGEYTKAIADFEKAIQLNPKHKEAFNNMGVALANLNNHREAISAYDKAITINPGYVSAVYNRGNSFAKIKELRKALNDYEAVVNLNPDYLSVYNNRGLVLKDLGMLEDALIDFNKAILLNPENAEAYSNRSLVRYALKDFAGALADNRKALELNPAMTNAYLNSGISKSRMGDFKSALIDFNNALSINASDKEVYLNRGITYYHMQNNDLALKDFEQAIVLDSIYGEAYLNRGILRANTGNLKGALADYNKASKLIPTNPMVYGNRAIIKFSNNDLKGVISDLNIAIGLDSAYADAYCNRGLAKANLGDIDGAMKDYNKAIKFNPSFGLAYNNRGVLRYQKGDKKGGCDDWNRALKAGFSGSKAFLDNYCK